MERSMASIQSSRRGRPAAKSLVTPRQEEILRLVAHDHTNREIANLLGLSVRTVEVHRFNLMRRLGVSNVAQLVRLSLKRRLLSKHAP